ncbi:hypothetical protein GCM10011344_26780 [Dokdonia pacifica]|uniref:Uncharacterized protein n=1 Tax=Dokdonia pacifica TaxID=1627892 RepID=A0A239E175_9FLAO|nr:hypothetical protein [Dokdonia pacifica]GGG24745.1 hypothetical protein GCM10011344_26780 [Dokdonia pacifica]SNS37732.1 hypothetical protein SAMN06265376_11318 [Dokdonia pacifica]
MAKSNIDPKVLEALAEAVRVKGKFTKAEMESKTFKDALAKELKGFGKEFSNELGGWRKAIFGF